jgi:hypothetical protein
MAATAAAISVFLVGDANGFSEDLILHRLLAEPALKLSNLTFELANFRDAYDLVIGMHCFPGFPWAIRPLQEKSRLGGMP